MTRVSMGCHCGGYSSQRMYEARVIHAREGPATGPDKDANRDLVQPKLPKLFCSQRGCPSSVVTSNYLGGSSVGLIPLA